VFKLVIYFVRCTFQIVGEKGQIRNNAPLTYGSFVRLVHHPTGLTVVASNQEDEFDPSCTYKGVYLRNTLSSYEEMAAQWQIMSRYRLRGEGESVVSTDFIVLRSFLFKRKFLTSVIPSSELDDVAAGDHLIGLQENAFDRLGWQINHIAQYATLPRVGNNSNQIMGGDFVRLTHTELRGHMIVRTDDQSTLLGQLAPSGELCKKLMNPSENSSAVLIRAQSLASDPKSTHSVWQLIPEFMNKPQPLQNGSAIRLRHLVTGCFLSIRPLRPSDNEILQASAVTILKPIKSDSKSDKDKTVLEKYVVGLTGVADQSTLFVIYSADILENLMQGERDSSLISSRDNIFFTHERTKMTLQINGGPRQRNENRSFLKKKKPNKKKNKVSSSSLNSKDWEYYLEDYPIRPTAIDGNMSVFSDAYRVDVVGGETIRDIIYASRFLPLAKACLSMLHFTPRMDLIYQPLFRHFNVALMSLASWVAQEHDGDGSLKPHPSNRALIHSHESVIDEDSIADNQSDGEDKPDDLPDIYGEETPKKTPHMSPQRSAKLLRLNSTKITKPTLSAMGPWIGRGLVPFSMSSILSPIGSGRDEEMVTRSYSPSRQNILGDLRLLEIIVEFTNVVYGLVAEQTRNLGASGPGIDTGTDSQLSKYEQEGIYKVPPIVVGCCILIHDVLHAAVYLNRRNAVQILAVRKNLLNLMNQEILGWRPPIGAFLVALQSNALGTVSRNVDSFETNQVLSKEDLHNLLRKTYELYLRGDEAAIHILELVITLCSPGQIPNRNFQNLISHVLFSATKREDTNPEEAILHNQTDCLLFSTRHMNKSAWEILLKVEFILERIQTPSSQVQRAMSHENRGLRDLFLSVASCKDERYRLSSTEAESILSQIGLAGPALAREISSLVGQSLIGLETWWWQRRRIYYPSSVYELNFVKREDMKSEVPSSPEFDDPDEDEEEEEEEEEEESLSVLSGASSPPPPGAPLHKSSSGATESRKTIFSRLFGGNSDPQVQNFGSTETLSARESEVPRPEITLTGREPLPPQNPTASSFPPHNPQYFFQFSDAEVEVMKGYERLRTGISERLARFQLGSLEQYQEFTSLLKRNVSSDEQDESNSSTAAVYTGLSIILNTSLAKATQSLKSSADRSMKSQWRATRSLLSSPSFDRDWLRKSTTLLSELCRGMNRYAQNQIRKLLPVQYVLELFTSSDNADKTIACTLLQNLYVEHDCVFSIRAITATQGLSLSLNELDYRPQFAAGLLFNDFTRHVRPNEAHSAHMLRRQLWTFVRNQLENVSLSVMTSRNTSYNVRFLFLLRQLILVGFFDESPNFIRETHEFTQAARENGLLSEQPSSSSWLFRCCQGVSSDDFSPITIGDILIDKVATAMHQYSTETDKVKDGILEMLSADRDQARISEEQFELIYTRIQGSGSVSVGSENIAYVNKYFSSVFGDSSQILAFREVLSILTLVHDMRQVERCKHILSMLLKPSRFYRNSLLSGEATIQSLPLKERITFSYSSKQKIEKLFIEDTARMTVVTESLMASSLHQDSEIKRSAYSLLYRHHSGKLDVKSILEEMGALHEPEIAALKRLFSHFLHLALKSVQDIFSVHLAHSSLLDEHLRDNLSFSLSAMRSLCFNSFRSNLDDTISHFPQTPLELHEVGAAANLSSVGVEMTRYSVLPHDDPAMEYSASVNLSKERTTLLSVTGSIAKNLPHPSRSETHIVLGEIVSKLLSALRAVVHPPRSKFLDWDALTKDMKFFVNLLLEFVADVCCGAQGIAQTVLLDFADLALQYLWQSQGATKFVILLTRETNLSQSFHQDFFDEVSRRLLAATLGQAPNLQGPAFLLAILSNGMRGAGHQKAMELVTQDILSNGSMRQSLLLETPEPSLDHVTFHISLLQLLAAWSEATEEEASPDLLRANLSAWFCNSVLSSKSPLQAKIPVISLAQKLYSHTQVPVLDHLLTDLGAIIELAGHPDIHCQHLAPVESVIRSFLCTTAGYLNHIARLTPTFREGDVIALCNFVIVESRRTKLASMFFSLFSSPPAPSDPQTIHAIQDGLSIELFFTAVKLFLGVLRLPALHRVAESIAKDKAAFESVLSLFSVAHVFHFCYRTDPKTMTPADKHLRCLFWEGLVSLGRLSIICDHNETEAHFLLNGGIDYFIRSVGHLLSYDSTDRKLTLVDEVHFAKEMDYLPVLPEHKLAQTAWFLYLKRSVENTTIFLDQGGAQLLDTNQLALKETTTLKRTPDFQKWLYCGGRYLMNLANYIEQYGESDEVTRAILHIFCLLLDNNIDEIRAQSIPLRAKMVQVHAEVTRLQRIQDTMDAFGICNLVLSVIGRSVSYSFEDSFVQQLVPLSLKLGFVLLASGNDSVQATFMKLYQLANTSNVAGNQKVKYFTVALRVILRNLTDKIGYYIKHPSDQPFSQDYLRLLCRIYDFCASLCSGHNGDARNFLRDQNKIGEATDLVSDIALSVDHVLHLLSDRMKYINFDIFYERLGPSIWNHNPDVKRRLIAWHLDVDYEFVCQLFHTLELGFNSLTEITQGPCLANQASALKCTALCPDLLEYVGAMQLRMATSKQGSFGKSTMVWDARNPLKFLRQYERELSRIGRFNDDPQSPEVIKAIGLWSSIGKRLGDDGLNSSVDILGVDLNLLFAMARSVETSCLRFLLALLEASSNLVCETLIGQLNDGILLQNMENHYKLSFESSDKFKSYRSAVTVQYLTLISTIASAQRHDPTVILDDLLLAWKLDKKAEGFDTEKLVASIEIGSPEGPVQRVYFPIPKFVLKYWSYPEVQKAKEVLLFKVNRESAEDKLSHFYDLMGGLKQVMRRQEKLRLILTPPVHALFGGSNIFVDVFPFLSFFKMKLLYFVLTIFSNIYYAYEAYRLEYPWIVPREDPGFRGIWDYQHKGLVLDIIGYCQIGLGAALFLREFMNR
jgi:hypothetical protein